MNKFLSAAIAGVLAMTAQQTLAYQQTSVNILVNGQTRNMVVFTPDNVTENLPLFIVTHGMQQDPEYQYGADKMYELIDKEQFIVTYLRSVGTTWDISGTSDQDFVCQSIGEMVTRYGIDPHRVYWSGFSMGSMLMYHCMANMQGKIAAFAPTSGVQFSEEPWNKCKKPVNLIHCHAYADDIFKYEQYQIHSYVENMAKMNKYTTYKKTEKYNPGAWFDGDKEVWTNDAGNMVELFSYNNGGHWPQQINSTEIWNFCKQYSLSDEELDPVEYPETPGDMTVNLESEVKGGADQLNGRTLFATDADCLSIWYVNSSLNESPQNVRCGTFNDIAENPCCWLKFNKVNVAGKTAQGTFYTIQMADKNGNNYSLWGSNGYLNTPPGEWCLFALGLGDNYGQDAAYYGLWEVNYEEGKGYTICNVGAHEANGKPWATPSAGTPQGTKSYVRLFTALQKVEETAIEEVVQYRAPDTRSYSLLGQTLASPRRGQLFVQQGRKCVIY